MFRREWLTREIEALAQAALRLVLERSGRLAGLTIRIPPELEVESFRSSLDEKLADVGLDFVDLTIEPAPGPMRIVAAEFQPE